MYTLSSFATTGSWCPTSRVQECTDGIECTRDSLEEGKFLFQYLFYDGIGCDLYSPNGVSEFLESRRSKGCLASDSYEIFRQLID